MSQRARVLPGILSRARPGLAPRSIPACANRSTASATPEPPGGAHQQANRRQPPILDGLGVGGHFFRVFGGNSFEQKKPDPIGVETLMKEAGVERSGAMMVGDSEVDVATARNAGIACCGVTYGFSRSRCRSGAPNRWWTAWRSWRTGS